MWLFTPKLLPLQIKLAVVMNWRKYENKLHFDNTVVLPSDVPRWRNDTHAINAINSSRLYFVFFSLTSIFNEGVRVERNNEIKAEVVKRHEAGKEKKDMKTWNVHVQTAMWCPGFWFRCSGSRATLCFCAQQTIPHNSLLHRWGKNMFWSSIYKINLVNLSNRPRSYVKVSSA